MANTLSQIYIQTVFAGENRLSLIRPEFKEDLYKYITGIVRNQGKKLISINGMPDHLHILIGLKPAMALADLVREIKGRLFQLRQQEQMGAGKVQLAGRLWGVFLWPLAIGYHYQVHSKSRKHHSRRSFKNEYLTLLREFDIAFDDKYVFKFIE